MFGEGKLSPSDVGASTRPYFHPLWESAESELKWASADVPESTT